MAYPESKVAWHRLSCEQRTAFNSFGKDTRPEDEE
jgi:hypothetical protein